MNPHNNRPLTGEEKRKLSYALARTKATQRQWELCEMAIKAFFDKYPMQMLAFVEILKKQRTEFGLAREGGLKKANFRHTASFPVIENDKGEVVDSLLPVLEKIIPRLTHKDSVNWPIFLKKFPIFKAGEKY